MEDCTEDCPVYANRDKEIDQKEHFSSDKETLEVKSDTHSHRVRRTQEGIFHREGNLIGGEINWALTIIQYLLGGNLSREDINSLVEAADE